MKLTFRGAEYSHEPVDQEVLTGDMGGSYRGTPWKMHRIKLQQCQRRKPVGLTYRGVAYKR
ncbi:MAG: DUF4278 domain-containing protein [Cyanobacteria bacterium P01_H01_bin.15]